MGIINNYVPNNKDKQEVCKQNFNSAANYVQIGDKPVNTTYDYAKPQFCCNCGFWERVDTQRGICLHVNSPNSMFYVADYDYINKSIDAVLLTAQDGFCIKYKEKTPVNGEYDEKL